MKPVQALLYNSYTDGSKVVLLLWIICFIYVLCLSCFRVCSLLHCGHLLGKDCHFLGQVWYLIESIPDLCHLSYFVCIFVSPVRCFSDIFSVMNLCFFLSSKNVGLSDLELPQLLLTSKRCIFITRHLSVNQITKKWIGRP